MSFIPHTNDDRAAMLKAIGVATLDDLFTDIPSHLQSDLHLPRAQSELTLQRDMAQLADRNRRLQQGKCFLGAGAWHHFIPATVNEVLSRAEFYTAYTPYQPEASQGLLQAMFEYQTMICELTGMAVSNASHYDGATALAEAALLALRVSDDKRNEIVVSADVNPRYRAVLRTWLKGQNATVCGDDTLFAPLEHVITQLNDTTAAVVVQSPDFFGQFKNVKQLATAVHENGALLIVVPDPISLGLFHPPGHYGADIVAAEGQSLGIPLSYGGPHLGIFATTEKLTRKTVGRLVGETVDTDNKRGYVLTLSTREQHIRRERATSNICTNAALTALAASVYLATMGKTGLNQVARLCYHKSHYAAQQIGFLDGVSVNPQNPLSPFFKEFVVHLPENVTQVNCFLRNEYDITGGYDLSLDYPELEGHMLIAVTELNTKEDIDTLVAGLERALT